MYVNIVGVINKILILEGYTVTLYGKWSMELLDVFQVLGLSFKLSQSNPESWMTQYSNKSLKHYKGISQVAQVRKLQISQVLHQFEFKSRTTIDKFKTWDIQISFGFALFIKESIQDQNALVWFSEQNNVVIYICSLQPKKQKSSLTTTYINENYS